jgi:hypothetical protein
MNGLSNPPPAHLRSMEADPDNDGYNNLLEYGLGTHPNNSLSIIRPTMQITGNTISYSYPRLRGNLQYLVQYSADLINWSNAGIDQDLTTPLGQPATAIVTIPSGANKIFLQLQIVQP